VPEQRPDRRDEVESLVGDGCNRHRRLAPAVCSVPRVGQPERTNSCEGDEPLMKRRRPESNRRWEFCRLLPYHLATAPDRDALRNGRKLSLPDRGGKGVHGNRLEQRDPARVDRLHQWWLGCRPQPRTLHGHSPAQSRGDRHLSDDRPLDVSRSGSPRMPPTCRRIAAEARPLRDRPRCRRCLRAGRR
jgi:hypothetical protein